jgi:hypothetical protein
MPAHTQRLFPSHTLAAVKLRLPRCRSSLVRRNSRNRTYDPVIWPKNEVYVDVEKAPYGSTQNIHPKFRSSRGRQRYWRCGRGLKAAGTARGRN